MEGYSTHRALTVLLSLAVAIMISISIITPLTTAVGTGTGQAASTSMHPATASPSGASGLTQRGPIRIIGDKDFTRENGVVAGSGTADDPYIIEGWEINASGDTFGIYIEDTTAYFIVRNCKIYGADPSGIFLHNVANGKITSNNIANNSYDGIHFDSSSSNIIEYNNIANNDYGIYLDSSSGNVIEYNNITDNTIYGIYLWGSSSNVIRYNNVANNDGTGIYLESSSNNVIEYNNIANNNEIGIYPWNSGSNVIAGNNFINNTVQVNSYSSSSTWDLGYPVGGNYWSDHECTDQHSGPNQDEPGSDGICDTPYQIHDWGYSSYQYDRYPLAKPADRAPPITITTTPATTTTTTTTTATQTTQGSTTTTQASTPAGQTTQGTQSSMLLVVVGAIAAVAVIVAVFVLRKR